MTSDTPGSAGGRPLPLGRHGHSETPKKTDASAWSAGRDFRAGPFKAYDIRGLYGAGIDDTLAFRVGRAFARFSGGVDLLGGYDARTHSGELLRAFAAGATSAGSRLYDAGCLSTPALHYLQMQRGYGAAVMATASHNPPQYHGFKLYDGSGASVSYAKGLAEIEAAVAADREPLPTALPTPPALPATAVDEYVAFATAHVRHEVHGMKVVIDISNGSAGALVQAAADALQLDATILNAAPNGTFPAHPPNPLEKESQREVAAAVPRTGAALGALLDGDGDRILFFDERGEPLHSYFAGALIASSLLGRHPGSAIVYDLISSRVFPEEIAAAGGVPVRTRVGYNFLYDEMVRSGAVYGNETSGHFYFRVRGSFYTESAVYGLGVLLNLIAERGTPLSELAAPLRARYVQQEEINIRLDRLQPRAALQRVREAFADGEQEELDGVSVSYDRFWFNVRPSNTEPLLRLRLEAVDEAAMNDATARIVKLLDAGR